MFLSILIDRNIMPAARPSANRFKNRLMQDAAKDRMLITVRCNRCRRQTHYWAADLIEVLGWNHEVHVPPWPCSKCRSSELVDVRWQIPSAEMLAAGLTIRRPVKKIEKWLWRDERV